MKWEKHVPGKHPVILVGAGFPVAMANSRKGPPSTADILMKTATTHPSRFPAIKAVLDGPLKGSDSPLNLVWSNVIEFARALLPNYRTIRRKYKSRAVGAAFTELVASRLRNRGPFEFLWLVLGIELKRAVALHYVSGSIEINPAKLVAFKPFFDELRSRQVAWVSLNYDLALEKFLEDAGISWKYCFEEWLGAERVVSSPHHVIVKPHGSLNVVFETEWTSMPRHSICFEDSANLFATIDESEVGFGADEVEKRPWLVGYLSDEQKDEINSPGWFADPAHDLCKGNLAYTSCCLLRATALYVVAYSMPREDEWIWRRLEALRTRDLPIYVATANDTDRVIKRFKGLGFTSAGRLTPDGRI
ncbi:MAG TPA: hypothetical protein VK395_26410 [Gemmataceae bacterium]|nr:hypothetical protein [Gemmataceae bacterium]